MSTKKTTPENKEGRIETVAVYIPSDGTGAFLEGAINGVNFRIPTDRTVEIPRHIANVIAESRKEMLRGAGAVEAFAKNGGRRIG